MDASERRSRVRAWCVELAVHALLEDLALALTLALSPPRRDHRHLLAWQNILKYTCISTSTSPGRGFDERCAGYKNDSCTNHPIPDHPQVWNNRESVRGSRWFAGYKMRVKAGIEMAMQVRACNCRASVQDNT